MSNAPSARGERPSPRPAFPGQPTEGARHCTAPQTQSHTRLGAAIGQNHNFPHMNLDWTKLYSGCQKVQQVETATRGGDFTQFRMLTSSNTVSFNGAFGLQLCGRCERRAGSKGTSSSFKPNANGAVGCTRVGLGRAATSANLVWVSSRCCSK